MQRFRIRTSAAHTAKPFAQRKPLGRVFLLLFLFFQLIQLPAMARPDSLYGFELPPKEVRLQKGRQAFLERLSKHPQWNPSRTVRIIQPKHSFQNRTADFSLLLLLLLLVGLVQYVNPRYFSLLWRAFYHPTHTSQALRDQLEADPLTNLGLNALFACATGAYLYALLRLYQPVGDYEQYPPALLLGAFIGGVALIYGFKWLAIRFSGWAFGVSELTDQYLFNVFLMNKILALLLVPFAFILAFADPEWAHIAVIISLIIGSVLIAMRYARSWMALRSFFSNSRFHFLTYFCASEILPLAVLTKFVARALFL